MRQLDRNLTKVALLLSGCVLVLFAINVFAWNGFLTALASVVVTRELGIALFLTLSLVLIVPYVLWSRIYHFIRNPLSLPISAISVAAAICGVSLLHGAVREAFYGVMSLPTVVIAVAVLFATAYCNYFLFTLAQKYEQTNQEKVKAERFKAELITNVSHDIQTPLTSVVNYVDLLRELSPNDADFDQKFSAYTEVLARKSDRLKTLASDLIEASKSSTGNIVVDMQAVNLSEALWQAAGEFDELFKEKHLTFVLTPADKQFEVQADPRHLWRVLENLYSNLAKYSLSETRVFAHLEYVPAPQSSVVRTDEVAKDCVRLCIKNTSAQALDQISGELTEQFMRGDKARRSEGSGLGLYIAKSLAALMGGSLRVGISGDQFQVECLFVAAASDAEDTV